MSQNDIINLLQQNPDKWFTCQDIAEKMDIGRQSISMNLKKLKKDRAIDFEFRRSDGRKFYYRHKEQQELPFH